jgi:ATP-binding cassette subfamily F protein 3
MAHAHLAIDEAHGFDARPRAQSMLLGLGFAREALDAPVSSFSGGWRMRLQLARALMAPARLMLLDEPTNHLDLDALVWLEAWLRDYDGTMIVISHDREFLDAVTRDTVHVDEGKLVRYGGNYSRFEETRAQRLALQQQAFDRQKDRIAHLRRFIDRFKAKATKAKQAQSRVKALARMELVAPVRTAADFAFEFREPPTLPNPMMSLRRVACGYGDARIVDRVDLTVAAGQRIGILGANGQGKSTLVKTIARALAPLAGEIHEGKGLSIGYFAQQEMDLLDAQDTPWQVLARIARNADAPAQDSREQALRNYLGQFAFTGDMVHQRVGTLSGGERARLVLACIVWQRPNLLLLDEPTNHLDLTTREALSVALNEFEGTVMLVSHDRALLREVCDEFLIVTRGRAQPFDGDVDDYQRWLLDSARAHARGAEPPPLPGPHGASTAATDARSPRPAPASHVAPASSVPAGRDERQQAKLARARLAEATRPLRIEIARIESRLEKLAAEKAEVERVLASGDASGNQYVELGRQLAHVNAEVAVLEERWLEVSAQLETSKSSPA